MFEEKGVCSRFSLVGYLVWDMGKLTFWYFFFNLLSLKLLTSSNFNIFIQESPLVEFVA